MNTQDAFGQSTSSSGSLGQAIRRHPLFFFFLLAYAFSWVLMIPYVLSEWGILGGNYDLLYILHTFGPTFSAILVTSVSEGKAGLQRLRDRLRQWRAGWIWYAFILVGIPALVMLGIVVQPGALASFQGLTARVLVSYPIYYIIVFFGGGPLGEEIGWRGFALPRMQPRYGPLWGTLLLGVLWSFWHLVDFLTVSKGGGPSASLATFFVNFPVFFLMVISLAIIFTWIFNHTGGSIFTAILAHASVNTPELTLVPLFLSIDMIGLHRAGLVGFGAAALLIVILTRGRLGYQEGQV
jgi:membrane protease YdiL (CAAX protease family)